MTIDIKRSRKPASAASNESSSSSASVPAQADRKKRNSRKASTSRSKLMKPINYKKYIDRIAHSEYHPDLNDTCDVSSAFNARLSLIIRSIQLYITKQCNDALSLSDKGTLMEFHVAHVADDLFHSPEQKNKIRDWCNARVQRYLANKAK